MLMFLIFVLIKTYIAPHHLVLLSPTLMQCLLLCASTSSFKCHLVDFLDELLQYLVAGFFFHWPRFIPVLFDMVLEKWFQWQQASEQEGLPLSPCLHKHILMWLSLNLLIPLLL